MFDDWGQHQRRLEFSRLGWSNNLGAPQAAAVKGKYLSIIFCGWAKIEIGLVRQKLLGLLWSELT